MSCFVMNVSSAIPYLSSGSVMGSAPNGISVLDFGNVSYIRNALMTSISTMNTFFILKIEDVVSAMYKSRGVMSVFLLHDKDHISDRKNDLMIYLLTLRQLPLSG